MLNYSVPPDVLTPHLPKGTEPDLWQGQAMVSVVGFLFKDTRVFGVKWPFHTNFEEINLRVYIRRWDGTRWKRGVAFVSEIVPKLAICLIANALYNEHYRYMPTRHKIGQHNGTTDISYGCKWRGKWNALSVTVANEELPIEKGSIEAFIFEHYWGYNQKNDNTTIEYGVEHGSWKVLPVQDYSFDFDIKAIYGPQWVPFLQAKPHSVMMAKGSDVIVRKPGYIKV
jgi:uncharacterized protein YqjF (DUF2071 family)